MGLSPSTHPVVLRQTFSAAVSRNPFAHMPASFARVSILVSPLVPLQNPTFPITLLKFLLFFSSLELRTSRFFGSDCLTDIWYCEREEVTQLELESEWKIIFHSDCETLQNWSRPRKLDEKCLTFARCMYSWKITFFQVEEFSNKIFLMDKTQ